MLRRWEDNSLSATVVTVIISSTVHNYRNIETMLCDRGDHTRIHRWAEHYASELEKRLPAAAVPIRFGEDSQRRCPRWVMYLCLAGPL